MLSLEIILPSISIAIMVLIVLLLLLKRAIKSKEELKLITKEELFEQDIKDLDTIKSPEEKRDKLHIIAQEFLTETYHIDANYPLIVASMRLTNPKLVEFSEKMIELLYSGNELTDKKIKEASVSLSQSIREHMPNDKKTIEKPIEKENRQISNKEENTKQPEKQQNTQKSPLKTIQPYREIKKYTESSAENEIKKATLEAIEKAPTPINRRTIELSNINEKLDTKKTQQIQKQKPKKQEKEIEYNEKNKEKIYTIDFLDRIKNKVSERKKESTPWN